MRARGGVKWKGGVLGWADGTLSQGRCEGETKNAGGPDLPWGGGSPGALQLCSGHGADGPYFDHMDPFVYTQLSGLWARGAAWRPLSPSLCPQSPTAPPCG